MKIKQDFVTNSSSTSFCAWGYNLDFNYSELPESLLEKAYDYYIHKENSEEITYDEFKEKIKDWCNDEDLFYHSVVEFLEESKLSVIVSWEAGEIYIGKSPFSIPDHMTMPEYKKEIIKELKEIGLDLGNLQIICQVIYC